MEWGRTGELCHINCYQNEIYTGLLLNVRCAASLVVLRSEPCIYAQTMKQYFDAFYDSVFQYIHNDFNNDVEIF
jgi:hypothetical protein